MNLDFSPVTFTFEAVGEITGTKYDGVFRCKPTLTYLERFAADEDKRILLGNPQAGEAINQDLANISIALAQCGARIVDGPSWYKETNGCRVGFVDTKVLIELCNKTLEVEAKWRESLAEQAKQAKELIQKNGQ